FRHSRSCPPTVRRPRGTSPPQRMLSGPMPPSTPGHHRSSVVPYADSPRSTGHAALRPLWKLDLSNSPTRGGFALNRNQTTRVEIRGHRLIMDDPLPIAFPDPGLVLSRDEEWYLIQHGGDWQKFLFHD